MSFYDNIKNIKYADKHSTYDNSQISYRAWRKWGELAPIFYPEYHKIEILSPASKVSYKTAVFSGADAIYFGYKEFNARAEGNNFDSLREVVDFCHLFRVKAYLALNIAIKDSELAAVKEIIIEGEQASIDAFIISDLALLPIIKKYSKAQVHASTQMGVHNYKGAQYLADLGCDRVILSREATINDIMGIKEKNVPISLEVFCHGALCVAFSGACLLSSMLSGDSGNRGRCAQLCRNFYKSEIDGKKAKEGYLLSAKDICMTNNIKNLYEAKIDAVKIEGRLRRNEYIGGVTQVYDKLRTGEPCEKEDCDNLKKLFNRGDFVNGYLSGCDNIIYPHIPSHIGLKCGKIVKIISKKLVLATSDIPINKDDGFKIIRNKQEVCGAVATGEVQNGKYVLFANTDATLQVGDELNITTDTALNKKVLEKQKRLLIEVAVAFVANENIRVIAHCKDSYVEFSADLLMRSTNLLTTKEDIASQFAKTKDTVFDISLVYAVVEQVYLSKAALNKLRRKIIAEIEKKLLSNYYRENTKKYTSPKVETTKISGDCAEISNIQQLTSLKKHNIKNIVYAPYIVTFEDCQEFVKKAQSENTLLLFKAPIFIPHDKLPLIEDIVKIFDGVVANNLALIKIAQENGKKVIAGYNLNITNNKNLLINTTNQHIASVELNKKELSSMKGCLIYWYGNLPLMYLNHCPRKLNGETCNNCGKKLVYKDAKGCYTLFTSKIGNYCQHTLKNGILTNLGNIMEGFYKYFDFSDTTNEEISKVLYNYASGNVSSDNNNKLHINRGVK